MAANVTSKHKLDTINVRNGTNILICQVAMAKFLELHDSWNLEQRLKPINIDKHWIVSLSCIRVISYMQNWYRKTHDEKLTFWHYLWREEGK